MERAGRDSKVGGGRERGEEMERLRPGEGKGKDKKREQKRIDWGGNREKLNES